MSLTREQISELNELREDINRKKVLLQKYESEVLDSEMIIRNLNREKKGRWIGFVIVAALFAIVAAMTVSYSIINYQSGTGDSLTGVLGFSVSTTVLTFIFLVLAFLLVCCVISGIKTIMELGTSNSAKKLADKFGKTNYPYELKKAKANYSIQLKELNNMKIEMKELSRRLDELESLETPWYEQ